MSCINYEYKQAYNDLKKVYRKEIISGKKKRIPANDNYISQSSNKSKAAWKIVKTEIGQTDQKPQFP